MTTRIQSKRFKWSLDSVRGSHVSTEALASPPAYSTSGPTSSADVARKTDVTHLITKKSWDLALGPLKNIPMNLFILYMAGNSISIFPIMMVGMFLMRPLQAIWSIKSTFKMVESSNAIGQMAVYILGNCVNLGLALYKCQSMGLLPTHSSDWLAFVDPPIQQEFLGGGIVLS